MRLEAVSVCVGYGDFLRETVKYNQGLFDEWIIVTDPADKETREVCRAANLRCLLSSDGSRFGKDPNGLSGPGGGFAKGHMVERGLQMLSADAWRIHVDADVALPHTFRHRLVAADLQKDHIYGIDRIMVKSWSEWQDLQRSGYMQGGQLDYHCRLQFKDRVEVGTRWCHPSMGYVPIGYFQMWHSSEDEWRGIRVRPYPRNHSDAARTDVQHALQWDRHKRSLIPEVIGVHLESEPLPKGANWKKRISKPFGPPIGVGPGSLSSS